MAEEGDSGEKTEDPTARRLAEARGDGQVGVSRDMSNVVGITAAFLALEHVAPSLWADILVIVHNSFTSRYFTDPIDAQTVHHQGIGLIMMLLPELFLIMFIAAFFGAGCTAVQTKFLWSWKMIKPKLRHLRPLQGLKRIFGIQNAMNTLKSIAKLCIIGPISYFAFLELLPMFMTLTDVPVGELLPITAEAMAYIFWKLMKLLFILALIDLIWQKYYTKKNLKMTKKEIVDERKSTEGDETAKRRIIAIGIQRARERMMKNVKTADVIVTNPTHIAIALAYSMTPGAAPKVIAKGKGHLAMRIRELAAENKIPIVERKPLARALYKMCDVGDEIPYELFKAVAELLAYVYRLKGKLPGKAKSTLGKKR